MVACLAPPIKKEVGNDTKNGYYRRALRAERPAACRYHQEAWPPGPLHPAPCPRKRSARGPRARNQARWQAAARMRSIIDASSRYDHPQRIRRDDLCGARCNRRQIEATDKTLQGPIAERRAEPAYLRAPGQIGRA